MNPRYRTLVRRTRAALIGAAVGVSLISPAWAQSKAGEASHAATQSYTIPYLVTFSLVIVSLVLVAKPADRLKEVKFRVD